MEYIFNKKEIKLNNTVVALGNFDGLHLGHQKLICNLKKYSEKLSIASVVFSFYPHPKSLLYNKTMYNILSANEKIEILENFGVDYYIEYPFDMEFAKTTPENFIKDIIVGKLGCKVLVVGEGYKFGSDKSGNTKILRELCNHYNIVLVEVPHENLEIHNLVEKVSSTIIRKYIFENKFQEVEKLLGRPYYIKGIVEEGKKIGRTIGFPTVNIIPLENKLLPNNGIYITKCFYNGVLRNSVTNVGNNPTVNGTIKTVETFIFDFNENIYGETISVYFYKWLRSEIKFNSVEELKAQIKIDADDSQEYFKSKTIE